MTTQTPPYAILDVLCDHDKTTITCCRSFIVTGSGSPSLLFVNDVTRMLAAFADGDDVTGTSAAAGDCGDVGWVLASARDCDVVTMTLVVTRECVRTRRAPTMTPPRNPYMQDRVLLSVPIALPPTETASAKPCVPHCLLKGYSSQLEDQSINLHMYNILVVHNNCAQRSITKQLIVAYLNKNTLSLI